MYAKNATKTEGQLVVGLHTMKWFTWRLGPGFAVHFTALGTEGYYEIQSYMFAVTEREFDWKGTKGWPSNPMVANPYSPKMTSISYYSERPIENIIMSQNRFEGGTASPFKEWFPNFTLSQGINFSRKQANAHVPYQIMYNVPQNQMQ